MIIAGAKVRIAPEMPAFAPQHQGHLGMRLEADDAIDHMRAGLLQRCGPADIGLLVEPRQKLHHGSDFLACPRGIDECLQQGGVMAGAVHSLLDRHHVRVLRRLLDEIDNGGEGLIRMVQQDIAIADRAEHIRLVQQCLWQPRTERRILKIRTVDLVRHLQQAHQVDRSVNAEHVRIIQAELFLQEVGHLRRAVASHLQPHRSAEMPLRQLALQGFAQILDFLLVNEQLAVAGDAELVATLHLHPCEQFPDMGVQDGRQEYKAMRATGNFLGQADNTRQRARRLNDGRAMSAAEGVPSLQLDYEVQALVQYARKGMCRVQTDRGQDRHQLLEEVSPDPLRLRDRPIRAA